eukprot:3448209-Rhodomonas_salina.1
MCLRAGCAICLWSSRVCFYDMCLSVYYAKLLRYAPMRTRYWRSVGCYAAGTDARVWCYQGSMCTGIPLEMACTEYERSEERGARSEERGERSRGARREERGARRGARRGASREEQGEERGERSEERSARKERKKKRKRSGGERGKESALVFSEAMKCMGCCVRIVERVAKPGQKTRRRQIVCSQRALNALQSADAPGQALAAARAAGRGNYCRENEQCNVLAQNAAVSCVSPHPFCTLITDCSGAACGKYMKRRSGETEH